ncbi:MAG: cytochrome c biogenesis protein ResB [Bacillota bacterium]
MWIWKCFTSMRLSLTLFIIISLASFAGSIIPQGAPPLFYEREYGLIRGGIITALGLNQVFSAPWFVMMGFLLGLNLTVCIMQRMKALAKRPSWRKSGSVVLHTGLVLVLIGSAVSSFDKHGHYFEAREGELKQLSLQGFPFDLFIKDFTIEYFENNLPRQYRSTVQVIKSGVPQKEKEISVNHPLKFGGAKVYQTSFGWLIEGEIAGNQRKEKVVLRHGDVYQISADPLLMMKVRFFPDYSEEKGQPVTLSSNPRNPKVACQIYNGTEYLGGKALSPGESVSQGGLTFLFSGYQAITGLQVKRDRGVPYVWTGFLLAFTGIVLRYLGPDNKKVI